MILGKAVMQGTARATFFNGTKETMTGASLSSATSFEGVGDFCRSPSLERTNRNSRRSLHFRSRSMPRGRLIARRIRSMDCRSVCQFGELASPHPVQAPRQTRACSRPLGSSRFRRWRRPQTNSPLYWDSVSGPGVLWSTSSNWWITPTVTVSSAAHRQATADVVFNGPAVNGATTVQSNAPAAALGLYFVNTGTTLLDSSSSTPETLSDRARRHQPVGSAGRCGHARRSVGRKPDAH